MDSSSLERADEGRVLGLLGVGMSWMLEGMPTSSSYRGREYTSNDCTLRVLHSKSTDMRTTCEKLPSCKQAQCSPGSTYTSTSDQSRRRQKFQILWHLTVSGLCHHVSATDHDFIITIRATTSEAIVAIVIFLRHTARCVWLTNAMVRNWQYK